MLSYVFMKILEGRPRSYDQRMDTLSRGRVRKIKEAAAAEIEPGAHVLEIGCGTGELASILLSHGATRVEGFDLSPSMIAVARERIKKEGLDERLRVRQMGVDGMDGLPPDTYDTVVSTLVFSELTPDERRFALKHAFRVLKPGGRLVIGDEVVPTDIKHRIVYQVVRAAMLILTYLVSKAATRPLRDLAREVTVASFVVAKETRSHGGAFVLLVAQRPSSEGSR